MSTIDFMPTANLQTLAHRASLLAQLRSFFTERGFWEVETPLLSHDTVVDQHIEPIRVSRLDVKQGVPRPASLTSVAGESSSSNDFFWLQTSPEFGMKRLLAAGATHIFQICKSFRAKEQGRYHNPEFTMLEWYRVGDNLQTGMDLLAELIESVLKTKPTQRASYRELFEQPFGINPHTADVDHLRQICQGNGIEFDVNGESKPDRDFWLNLILAQLIEPTLGINAPLIVYDWPVSQSALAVVRQEPFAVAERFELYVRGVEIANGYHELLDANELERRTHENNQKRMENGNQPLPINSRLLAAMRSGLPACAGVALGVDRLVMLATGSSSIDEVIAFPIDRA